MHKRGWIGWVVLFFLLVFLAASVYFLYFNFSEYYANPIGLIQNGSINENITSYSGNLQFYPNMRFASPNIGYWIEEACSDEKKTRTLQAFNYLQNLTPIKFYSSDFTNAKLIVRCQELEQEPSPGSFFIAGEGGPTSIINTSLFNVIQEGKILLFYKSSRCKSFNIELHESLHVLGFDHSPNKESIMYNFTYCDQIVTKDILGELNRVYSFKQLPDLYFDSLEATKHGSYLDFNVSVRNRGLNKANSVSLNLYSAGEKFYSYDLQAIDYGEGKSLQAKNIKSSRSLSSVKFVISAGDELDSTNNVVELVLP